MPARDIVQYLFRASNAGGLRAERIVAGLQTVSRLNRPSALLDPLRMHARALPYGRSRSRPSAKQPMKRSAMAAASTSSSAVWTPSGN